MKRITSFLLAIVVFAGLVLTGAPVAHAASNMRASDELVDFLKGEEGFSAKPYWDYGQYTVGYGTRCPDDMLDEYKKNGITKKEAETLLRNYLSSTEKTINKNLIDKYNLKLTQSQFDAIVTFTYNCGSAWISRTDYIIHKAIKNGATGSELINAFTIWCTADGQILSGLVRRRLCEANIYLNGKYSNDRPSDHCYVYYNANGGSVEYRIQGYDADEGVAPAYKATYSGHKFLGWYTAKTGGSKVTKLTKNHHGDTLYARWDNEEQKVETDSGKGVTVTVTGSGVNLRQGPGTNYKIVGTADKGDQFVITETDKCDSYQWGKSGDVWICLQYTDYDTVIKEQEKIPEETTKPTEPEPSESETTTPETTEPAVVTGKVKVSSKLKVRKGPGSNYDIVKYLKNGTKVTVTEQRQVGSLMWGKIGEDQWVSMRYIVLDKAEATTPETTVPETTVPETTVPETTVPETTVPETTVPETTVPETTVPETTVPETTVPETTVPETTAPETTEPEETEPEQKPVTGKVKVSSKLKVRKGPGSSYAVVKNLKNGTKVTITEQKKVGSLMWGKIGKDQWVSMRYIVLDKETSVPETTEPKETEPAQKPVTGKVKVSSKLKVRKGPGSSYAIVKYLKNGTKVTVTEQKTVNGTTWGKIGTNQWVSIRFIVLDGEKENTNLKTVTASCLNVRKTASASAKIVGCYYKGDKVEILETKKVDGTTWGKTSKGWVSMDYVK